MRKRNRSTGRVYTVRQNELNIELQVNSETGSLVSVEWRDVVGYEDSYEVSNYGHIVNKKSKIVLKPHTEDNGYQRVSLYVDGKVKRVLVHRIVAEAFLTNSENKPEVNHIDTDKVNNCSFNLEYNTSKENVTHAKENGLLSTGKRIKLGDEMVISARKEYSEGESIRQIAKRMEVSQQSISLAVRYITYKSI